MFKGIFYSLRGLICCAYTVVSVVLQNCYQSLLTVLLPIKALDGKWYIVIPYSAKFSWVFNIMKFANFPSFVKIFQRKFLTRDTHTSCSHCKSIDGQHPRAKLPNSQGNLSKEVYTFKIALLTAASSSGRQCDGTR